MFGKNKVIFEHNNNSQALQILQPFLNVNTVAAHQRSHPALDAGDPFMTINLVTLSHPVNSTHITDIQYHFLQV